MANLAALTHPLPLPTGARARIAATCAVLLAATVPHLAGATVLFDNYRGRDSLPAGATPVAPNYGNNDGTRTLSNLINLASGGPQNVASSGRLDDLDWSSNEQQLCNTRVGNAPCAEQIQGRVAYTLVRFPTAGTYTFKAAHDDDLQVDFSTNFSAASASNYRNFDYNVPVGGLSSYTSETSFPDIPGNFVASQDNSCYAMRVYWNNRGGLNFLRMKWVKPGGIEEIIPAANLLDPSKPESYASCANTLADIAVSKTGPAQFTQGGTLNYAIKVWNYGPTEVSGIPIADLLPGNVTLLSGPTCTASGSAQCGSSSNNGNAWVMTTGLLPVNTTAGDPSSAPMQGSYLTYQFAVRAAANALSIKNTATVATNDLNPDNNSSTVISQSSGKVSVSKTGPAKVAMGQAFDYQFIVNNGLGVAVPSAVIAEQLPANMQALSVNGANCGALPSATGALLTCRLQSSIAAGGTGAFTLRAVATSTGVVTNYASTDPSGGTSTGTPGASCDASRSSCTSAKTEVVAPAVAVSKSFSPASIGSGGSSLLTITVSNANSSIDLHSLSVTDALPADVFATGNLIGNTCFGSLTAPGNSQLTLSGGTLAAGASCQLRWMVTSSAVGAHVNTIPAGGVTSAEGAVNTAQAQATLSVHTPADPATSKKLSLVNGAPYQGQRLRNGDVLVYDITVTNSGGVAATTDLTETVPNGATYTGVGEGWSTSPGCTTEGSTCEQTNITVAPGGTVTKQFTLTISPPVLTPTFINTVTSSVGDCNACTVSSPGVFADMVATGAASQEVQKGSNVTVVTSCTNQGPDYGVNATCSVTGAPAGATTVCTPSAPVPQFQVGAVLTCTTTFKAEQSGPVMLVTSAYSETSDPEAGNNKAISAVTVLETDPIPVDGAAPVPMDARWMLVLISLAIAAVAMAGLRRSRPD